MIEMGLIVAFGLIMFYVKAGWKARLWVNSHPLTVDVIVFVAMNAIHWGTFSGVMVAAISAAVCSVCISVARKWFGYIGKNKVYVPGWVDLLAR